MPATDDPARRAEAAALWQAIGASADDAQRDAQRMQKFEATLSALREQTARNQQTLLEVRSELAQARESRYRNPVVYALGILLLLALVGMFMLWRLARRATTPTWWGEASTVPDGTSGEPVAGVEEKLRGSDGARVPADGVWQAPAPVFRNSQFDDIDTTFPSGYGAVDASVARTPDGAPLRPVNTEELFDVQQQSDFFLSLGQHDQAIAVLSEHIADNPGTSALAYLDLLRIFHSLGRRDDYARLRHEFERVFNADVPEFEKFSEAGHGLEHYRSALARIESQWPAPGTLALIEELVFRKPGALGDETFDLVAYRELLLLYSVAKEVIDPDRAPPAPVTPLSFVDTFGHAQEPTAPLPIEAETRAQPAPVIEAGPRLPSLYGAIDETLRQDTVLVPDGPPTAGTPLRASTTSGQVKPQTEIDLAEFDATAFETIAADIEAPIPSASVSDPNVIDFDLFDAATEAEIAPGRSLPRSGKP